MRIFNQQFKQQFQEFKGSGWKLLVLFFSQSWTFTKFQAPVKLLLSQYLKDLSKMNELIMGFKARNQTVKKKIIWDLTDKELTESTSSKL